MLPGRAGRTGPGICYRLYSEEQYNKMDDFTTSEINRVSLQEMALRMISLNLGLDPRTFPFIERPETEKLNDALDILKFQIFHIGALFDYGVDEYILKIRQVLEDAGLIEKPDAHELGEDDSRQRRIDQGDRKKLLDMKRDAR
ncbi:hypothetical protein ANCDUO_22674 [Ancylostoma duodenale]|uniref:Uncharacterized protein n=1 Tax=Ancylostoma duodenale TaxID=51022 RepID=A0A0C2FF96_9BILA|nr:hypothetical protein ANCDUO_22674 [Ancylostoma duodenale]